MSIHSAFRHHYRYCLTLICFSFWCISCASSLNIYAPSTHAKQAELAAKEGNYQKAIIEYQAHFEARQSDSGRPNDENPYFYYLLIGDLYLKMNDPEQAEAAYDIALAQQVTSTLLSDRYRHLGRWFSQHQRYEDALKVLHKHRGLDPQLFDIEIDAAHKLWIKRQN